MAIEQLTELDRALQLAADRHASDLYLVPDEPVSLRVNGVIERTTGEMLTGELIRRIATAAVGPERLTRMDQERGRIVTSCKLDGVAIGRMCIARCRGEFTIVIRVMGYRIPTVEEIALPKAVVQAGNIPSGLIVFAGPMGSGKTTSAMSLLDHVNATSSVHICTVQDPIPLLLTPKRAIIQQREVGVDVPDTISGIIAALDQDMDVLFVGDLRSPEEVQGCLTAALSGHLVMTQVHASTPQMALERLIESQPPENLVPFRRHLAKVIGCICAQVLINHATQKGLRVAAYGVLIPDDEMRKAIAEGRDVMVREKPLPHGCQNLFQDIQRLEREGQITSEEAERISNGHNVFE